MADNVKPANTPQNAQGAGKPPIAGGTEQSKVPIKPGAVNRSKQTPQGKPKRKTPWALIVGLLLTLLFAAAVGMVYFDIAGFKDTAVTALKLTDPTKSQIDTLDTREKEFTDRENSVLAAEEAQKTAAKDFKAREKTITEKEKELADREAAITQKQAELDALAATQNTADITSAVTMFSNMDPIKAAQAMSGVKNPDDIALLLIHMDSKKSAAILDNMKASLATKVMTSIVKMQKAAPVQQSPAPSTSPTASPAPTP